MRILVAIASYGTANDHHLARLLSEYRSMPYEIEFVVLSNLAKNLGSDVEVRVGLPAKNPWSLPFAHKKIFAERLEDYDLFLYSEDDTLVRQTNIEAFLGATAVLRENEIAGFFRSEVGIDGRSYFSTVHSHFRWDPGSVVDRGPYTFAHFTNDHSGCFLLTREQLRKAIHSGGFLVDPHEESYDLLVSAATDPYTQCGLRKLICLSRLDDFLLSHLPNKYIGSIGLERSEFERQIAALLDIQRNGRPRTQLIRAQTMVRQNWGSKSYYEPCHPQLLEAIPRTCRRVLSVGCGWGATEGELVKRGLRVVGVPLDSVIAACAEARGVEIVYGDLQTSKHQLAGERFDCLLLSNVLQLVSDPVTVLSSFAQLLTPDGSAVVAVPNLAAFRVLWRRLRGQVQWRLGNYPETGLNWTSPGILRRWFRESGLPLDRIIPIVPQDQQWALRFLPGRAEHLLAPKLIAIGKQC